MTYGLDLPAAGPLTADHAAHLLGRGPGLTPLGDDVLAGWFAARHAAGLPDTTLAAAVRPRLGDHHPALGHPARLRHAR